MRHAIYDELVDWYQLLDPRDDHEDEVASFVAAIDRAVAPAAETLLELGAGAGNNGFFLKRSYRCTLTDVSEPMLARSRRRNPECDHALGDLRAIRLGKAFDAVLVHDAICYMTTEDDLRAAIETAFVHTRPGGAALFVPDALRDTFAEGHELLAEDDGERSLRCLAWTWDPDPSDSLYAVDYAFLLRDGASIRAVHDRHVEGLFAEATWVRLLEAAGFAVGRFDRPLGDGAFDRAFVCTRL